MLDVHVVAIGAFGEELAAQLANDYQLQVSTTRYEAFDSARWPRSRVQVVACAREEPRAFELADSMAYALRRPWLAAALDATSLRVGPLVDGAESACYSCFVARQYQHQRFLSTDKELFAAYRQDPSLGVRGHLSAHVALAASAARTCIDAVLAGRSDESGRVRRFGLLTPHVSVETVVPVHGCRRCDAQRPDASWADLARDVALLPGRGAEVV